MAAGFQSFRGDSTFQIDGDAVSMVLVRKATIALTSGAAPSGDIALLWSNTIALNAGEILAIRPLLPANLDGIVGSGNPAVQISGPGSRYGGSDGGTQVQCYVFSSAPPAPSAGPGLQVFRSNGTLAYDSGSKHLHIVGVHDGEGDFTYQSGRLYASIACNRRVLLSDPGGTGARVVTGRKAMVLGLANGIRVSYGVTDTTITAGGTNLGNLAPSSNLSRHVVIDVTNY